MSKSKCFYDSFFICSMEYLVFVCGKVSWKKERCKETKWRYDRVEKAERIVGRARDCVHRSLAKAMFAVGGNERWSHREFCVSGGFGERRVSPLNLPRGEMRARCRERD